MQNLFIIILSIHPLCHPLAKVPVVLLINAFILLRQMYLSYKQAMIFKMVLILALIKEFKKNRNFKIQIALTDFIKLKIMAFVYFVLN